MVAGVCMGLSSCSLIGGNTVNQEMMTQTNLSKQRTVALKFVKDYSNPALKSIRFTREGGVDGGGSWTSNAVLTVAGRDYNEILGTNFLGGDPLPTIAVGATPGPVTVTYSDGTSEVLR
jgi:hypothetical protein